MLAGIQILARVAMNDALDPIERDEAVETRQEWRIPVEFQRRAAAVWEPGADVAQQDEAGEVRLFWRVIDTFGNVSWPSGLHKLH